MDVTISPTEGAKVPANNTGAKDKSHVLSETGGAPKAGSKMQRISVKHLSLQELQGPPEFLFESQEEKTTTKKTKPIDKGCALRHLSLSATQDKQTGEAADAHGVTQPPAIAAEQRCLRGQRGGHGRVPALHMQH